MNQFGKALIEAFPTAVLNRRADKLLTDKPSGFHPVKKRVYRRECQDMLESYQHMINRRREGRIFGNKSVSATAKLKMEILKERAR